MLARRSCSTSKKEQVTKYIHSLHGRTGKQKTELVGVLFVYLFVSLSGGTKKDMSETTVSVPGNNTGRDNLEVACTRFERTKEILANNIF